MTLSTIERVLFLRSVELFDDIASEDLVSVAQACREMIFEPGDRLITQDAVGDRLFILVDGTVSVSMDGVGEIAQRVGGESLGEMSILSNRPRSANCDAIMTTAVLVIERDDFWQLLAERPALALGVIKVLSRRLDEAVENFNQLRRQGHLRLGSD